MAARRLVIKNALTIVANCCRRSFVVRSECFFWGQVICMLLLPDSRRLTLREIAEAKAKVAESASGSVFGLSYLRLGWHETEKRSFGWAAGKS